MNKNIKSNIEIKISSPLKIKKIYKLYNKEKVFINKSRKIISEILKLKNKKFIIICGPCSINDYNSSIEYAKKFKNLSNQVYDVLYLIMRVYLEKPRTYIGWKGLINDPYINNTFNIEDGIKISRKLLIDISKLEIPIATEILNPIISNYISDTLSWISIGARTSESQIHREIISGLNIPTGFKNNTNGDIYSAINSVKSSSKSHNFISINNNGKLCILKTSGNNCCNIILRGGKDNPNYFINNVINCNELIKNNNINTSIIIDCSHDNSKKNYKLQTDIAKYIIEKKINEINYNVSGIMIESNLYEGNQNINYKEKPKYGISITDSCIGWNETEYLIKYIYNKIKNK